MISRTLSELADLCGAEVLGDGGRVVTGPAPLAEAGPREVSFLAHPRYKLQLESTGAAGVLVGEGVETGRDDLTLLRHSDPGRAFSKVILAFAPPTRDPVLGVHPAAWVDPSAELGDGVTVGPASVVGPGARLGDRVLLHPGVVVGPDARVGADSVLHPGVVIYERVELGERCVVHGGAVLGADGFGFDLVDAGWEKTPQCGTVLIGADVEIGANTTVDRARFGATRIGDGAKIDNLVHLGHNVRVGEHAMLVAQVGVAGSTRIGARAIVGGKVGLLGHLDVGAGARIGAGSLVYKDVPAGEDYFGIPASPKAEAMRRFTLQGRLSELYDEVRELRRRMKDVEERGS